PRTAPLSPYTTLIRSVSGFTGSDVVIGGTAGGTTTAEVTGGPSTYTVAVSGLTTGGTVIATIPAGGATDAAGNGNTASTSTDNTVTFDPTPPTVTINQAAGPADPPSPAPITFPAVFSETVSGFTGSDVVIGGTAGGTKTVEVTALLTYTTLFRSGLTTGGTVIATIPAGGATDAAGNGNTASTSTDNTVTFDPTPPTVTINQAAGQADPTSTAPITFTARSEERRVGKKGRSRVSGGPEDRNRTVDGPGGDSTRAGAVSGVHTCALPIATIPAGGATDAAGNGNTASTSTDNTVTFDPTPPTVTINQAAGQADPTSTAPITFTA